MVFTYDIELDHKIRKSEYKFKITIRGVMWGRESGTSKYGLEYSSKPGSKWGNLKLALNMALNPAPKWAPNWISRYGFRVAPNLLFEWGLHLFLILLITLSTVYK